MKKYITILQKAILAGISISLGGVAFLKMGGIIGAILFSFGLLTCCHFGLSLFTGSSGFIYNKTSSIELVVTLLGNIIGCLLTSLMISLSLPELSEKAMTVMTAHFNYEWYQALFLSIFCGFIMTVAVRYGRRKLFLPLLFGVPLFIVCGFIHSIADAFYITMCPFDYLADKSIDVLAFYLIIVLGNFIGCNLYRIIMLRLDYD